MIGSFSFNSVNSESFGLITRSIQRPLLPSKKLNRVELPGASGAIDSNDHEYGLRQIVMLIQYKESSFVNLRSKARQIAAWLSTDDWCKLIINDEPDKYYLAKISEGIDLNTFLEAGIAEITFDCQPFALSVQESEFEFDNIVSSTNCEFTNPGTREINFRSPQGSKFLITIVGTWTDLELSLNDYTLEYTEEAETSTTLIINNVDMEAAIGEDNKFGELNGDIDHFLSIIPGDNVLSVSGTDINVKVTINFIPLWM